MHYQVEGQEDIKVNLNEDNDRNIGDNDRNEKKIIIKYMHHLVYSLIAITGHIAFMLFLRTMDQCNQDCKNMAIISIVIVVWPEIVFVIKIYQTIKYSNTFNMEWLEKSIFSVGSSILLYTIAMEVVMCASRSVNFESSYIKVIIILNLVVRLLIYLIYFLL